MKKTMIPLVRKSVTKNSLVDRRRGVTSVAKALPRPKREIQRANKVEKVDALVEQLKDVDLMKAWEDCTPAYQDIMRLLQVEAAPVGGKPSYAPQLDKDNKPMLDLQGNPIKTEVMIGWDDLIYIAAEVTTTPETGTGFYHLWIEAFGHKTCWMDKQNHDCKEVNRRRVEEETKKGVVVNGPLHSTCPENGKRHMCVLLNEKSEKAAQFERTEVPSQGFPSVRFYDGPSDDDKKHVYVKFPTSDSREARIGFLRELIRIVDGRMKTLRAEAAKKGSK